ncbi:MAG TPA: helix-turn-helix domain-containing protein [Solirubrobacteraceae bacterium]|nr:helix-turn-helix domain-containing protein [Solirubrobacteraceae bacterium]
MSMVKETASPVRCARELQARAPAIARAAAAEIRARVPGYGPIDARTADELQHAIQSIVEALCHAAIAGEELPSGAIREVRGAVRGRLRSGISMSDWIQASRIGHGVAWKATLRLVEAGAITHEEALAASDLMLGYLEHVTAVGCQAYLEGQRLDRPEHDRAARELFEDLMGGTGPSTAAHHALAAAAGLGSGARFAVLVLRPLQPVSDEGWLRAAAETILRAARVHDPLSVIRGGEVEAIAPIRPSIGAAWPLAPLRRAQLVLAEQGTRLAVGISRAADDLAQIPFAHREACVAADRVSAHGGVARFDELSLLEYLAARAAHDSLALELIPARVRAFVEDELAGEGAMLGTLRAYAEAEMNATEAAKRLFVHVNTAHYRLRRIQERTGLDVRSLDDLLELLTSVRLLEERRRLLVSGCAPDGVLG